MKRFVISDSHGGYKALVQCLERCGFDKGKDQLIFLGDVVDGWSETKESIDLLLKLKHLVYLLGNHDQWALKYYTGQLTQEAELKSWLRQGGAATVASYGESKSMPPEHLELLQQAKLYLVTDDNLLFVHAGFDTSKPLTETDVFTLIWSRDFIENHYRSYQKGKPFHINGYKEVYIGHTPTILLDKKQTTPLRMDNLILLDTGAGYTGRLSIMDIDSQQVWQSDPVMTLYPQEEGRSGLSWNDRRALGLVYI
ncbi:metallophosphoesterase family protein [Pontibacter amylolyticus]|uniref:Metallophosphatase n=1 Tax=Pontibacter amylolyticus TaxID=1424080 RepID=A0ABQ1WIJ0_9BACT|nr:metallophosphoesterase family protein [Pontibacter amylolyticus]GGG30478.1 metallophosphatase [Pontibacter amylolyticus]